jgi:hypothetical protein
MGDDRYITIKVAFDRGLHGGRSLGAVAPELIDAGLRITEDHRDDPIPTRTWAGSVDAATFERFADAWHLDEETDVHTFDGMNWEVGGESPIVYVSIHVAVVRAGDEAGQDDPLPVPAS